MVHREEERASLVVRQLIEETAHALAHLDSKRLEELTEICRSLNGSLETVALNFDTEGCADRRRLVPDLVVLRSVLDVTKANFYILERLVRPVDYDRLGYGFDLRQVWN